MLEASPLFAGWTVVMRSQRSYGCDPHRHRHDRAWRFELHAHRLLLCQHNNGPIYLGLRLAALPQT